MTTTRTDSKFRTDVRRALKAQDPKTWDSSLPDDITDPAQQVLSAFVGSFWDVSTWHEDKVDGRLVFEAAVPSDRGNTVRAVDEGGNTIVGRLFIADTFKPS